MKLPEVWKTSNVCSIPKVTPYSRVEELRPISLTSVISKVQETYAVKWILEDVQEELSDSQFGDLVGSSAVLEFMFICYIIGIKVRKTQERLWESPFSPMI
jgi:hypothetical protein